MSVTSLWLKDHLYLVRYLRKLLWMTDENTKISCRLFLGRGLGFFSKHGRFNSLFSVTVWLC